ncbi:NAD-dependent epimerase/dehydratase family protein [Streptomyces sp. NPDC102274]|uniref:NAD-dependent epimerase/dehydratase family protein n=1 Tax=Streptomyces sp. NPDC102274 TaxID=3366151 RepID=UPI00380B02B9
MPRSPYGAAKLAVEEAIGAAASIGRLGAISLCLFNAASRTPFGGTPSPLALIPQTVAAGTGRTPVLAIDGDSSVLRDFVHVRDVAAAVAAGLARTPPGGHHAYNIGTTPASELDVLAEVGRAAGRAVPVQHRSADETDTSYLAADTADTRAALD